MQHFNKILPSLTSIVAGIIISVTVTIGLYFGLTVRIVDKEAPQPTTQVDLKSIHYENPILIGDIGSSGYPHDSSLWFRDYSHHGAQFSKLFLKEEPYIDAVEFEHFKSDITVHLKQIKQYGFNTIEVPGFIEFVDFKKLADPVYQPNSEYTKRHAEFRKRFGEIFRIANSLGFKVILKTDMVVLSRPLEQYLIRHNINRNVDNPEFWKIYSAGLEELFEEFPEVDGIMIRIGEAGAIYSQQGWDYWSELIVTSNESTRRMLQSFIDVAAKYNRKVIFRSWAVGIGKVGKIHTVPEAYASVLNDIQADNFYVSTKYSRGDFWSYLPLNPTLVTGPHNRLVEFQTRREFEGWSSFPNYTAGDYQKALQSFVSQNPNIKGGWIWTHAGGPLFQAPRTFYLHEGLWVWIDANLFTTAKLLLNPNSNLEDLTDEWIRLRLGDDPLLRSTMKRILLESHERAQSAVTFRPFAKKQVYALAQEVPPVSFSYWNIVGGNSSIFSHLYLLAKDDIDSVIAADQENTNQIKKMNQDFHQVANRITKTTDQLQKMKQSFDYMQNVAETLMSYRIFFLNYFAWLDGKAEPEIYKKALSNFEIKLIEHENQYQNNFDFPAYNFTEALRLVDIAKRTTASVWSARLLLIVTILLLIFSIRKIYSSKPNSAISNNQYFSISFGFLIYLFAVGLTFSAGRGIYFSILIAVMGLMYLVLFHLLFRSTEKSIAYSLTAAFAMAFVVLAFIALRGPFYFWFQFWISPSIRALFLIPFLLLAVLGYGWVIHGQKIDANQKQRLKSRLAIIVGSQLFIFGLIMKVFGLNPFITTLNNELVVLPYFLSLIHGFVVHLNIPTSLPIVIMSVGLVPLLIGGVQVMKK